ncbi:uncharacterized protein RHOBADRAFT_55142 [Rhodotorula graminis WP1]|uniref:FAD-binding FR-type domain-containing protein n=1 Tax=Rhodotorula graminis (strain WP1) TaxID=578459 RepID=A0A0P9EW05_RHOGW|nr:uncharacterized protein RHOBADRAFT_55142 [Rhodotorula graminis WP1]KPV73390.1 hypothetical protein RHOBADRAFT_55142 [Rhodotorula graminis WP1]
MPLGPARPEPWPSTVEEALALPASWHVNERFLRALASGPDPEHNALMVQSYIAFLWNSFSTARWANTFLWKCVAAVALVGLARRLITPASIRQLPRPLRRAHTSFVKHYSLAPLAGSTALAARPVLSKSSWSAWTTVQVPLRPQAVLVAAYVVANIVVVFSGYDIPIPNGFYSEKDGHLAPFIRHASDRTGVLALGSTPLVFLLAARNSPITWTAGVDFGSLQLFHRWIARVTYANAAMHVLGYSYIHLEAHDWSVWALVERKYLVLGWLAFIGGWVLCFGAVRRVRQRAYEFFLIMHIIAAIMWLVGAFFHVFLLGARGASHLQPCYLALALWGFDRGARRALVLWYNTGLGRAVRRTRRPTASSREPVAAEGLLLGGSTDFVRLRIQPKSPWSSSRGGPGSFVYVSCFSAGHRLWESHPFSIAWPLGVPEHLDDDLDDDSGPSTPSSCASGSMQGKSTRLDTLSLAAGRARVDAPVALPRSDPFDEQASPEGFELLVKRYSGFTQSLVDSLSLPLSAIPSSADDEPLVLAEPDDDVALPEPSRRRAPLRIVVEGPYGAANSSHPCATARQALFVAGGTGVAMVTSQLADLGLKVLQQSGETVCERVTVVWSVRESNTVALLVPYLYRLYRLFYASPSFRQRRLDSTRRDPHLPSSFVHLHIYVTSTSSCPSPPLASLDSLDLPSSFLRLIVHDDGRRPDIGAHVDALAPQDEDDPDELLVVSCGPAALCDATREAVRSRLGRWEACRLMHSEEAVVW